MRDFESIENLISYYLEKNNLRKSVKSAIIGVAAPILGNDIKVVPNPYIASSIYNETEYRRQIRFTNLPKNCKVTIYTVSGEEVVSFDKPGVNNHAECGDEFSGSCFWDMRTINNQEVAPGLYIFTVEDTSEGNENNKFVPRTTVIHMRAPISLGRVCQFGGKAIQPTPLSRVRIFLIIFHRE